MSACGCTDVLLLVVGILALLYYLSVRRPRNFPPGPRGWPLLGNLFQLGSNRHLEFIKLGETYGPIIGLHMGSRPTVVLNDYRHIKEALAEQNITGRPVSRLLKDRNLGGNRGILFSDGQVWSDQRRFCLRSLRDFGFGRKSMESMLMEEVNELIRNFRKEVGQPISTQNRFNIGVLNALWTILTGERFNHDDPRLTKLIKALTSVITKRPLSSILAEFVPLVYHMRKSLPFLFTRGGKEFQDNTYQMINEIIKQHRETLQEDNPRDFIDVYLIEMKKTVDPSSSFYKEEGYLGLQVVLLDLFVAGAETTSTTLTWAFLILALNPEKQEKLFSEIQRVVGSSRPVSLADRPTLLYLEATILEIMRLSSIVSLGVSHKTTEEIQFHGYTIPKNTTIVPNLYNAGRSKEVWGDDADEFRPERFLTKDESALVRHEAWIPFSTGRRICLGQTLAQDEMWLFMGNLFQNFKVTPAPGKAKPTMDYYQSAVLIPKPHELVLIDRLQSL